jgi:hypothetical protein
MGTEKQEKHTVSVTFLFTAEGHKAVWEPFQPWDVFVYEDKVSGIVKNYVHTNTQKV